MAILIKAPRRPIQNGRPVPRMTVQEYLALPLAGGLKAAVKGKAKKLM